MGSLKRAKDYLFLLKLFVSDRSSFDVIASVIKKRLTYLNPQALYDLYRYARNQDLGNVEGDFVELGCALGGSAIVLGKAKKKERKLLIYDVFGQIPPPSENDGDDAHQRFEVIESGSSTGIGEDKYYGYTPDLLNRVVASFEEHGLSESEHHLEFIPGLYEDTLNPIRPVALAHIDCDWYDSVYVCLERLTQVLSKDGRLIIDDYHHWSGCKRAVDDFFRDRMDEFRFEFHDRLHIVKC